MINLTCPINSLGYGIVGKNILLGLSKLDEVCLWPIGQIEIDNNHNNTSVLAKAFNNAREKWSPNNPSLRIFHQFDLAQHVGNPRIGFPIFELNSFKLNEIQHLKNQDKLIVCSDWAKQVLISNNIKIPIDVIPLGVDRTIFNENLDKEKCISILEKEGLPKDFVKDKIVFFTCGKWEIRKGHNILIECFEKAFSERDDVVLIMNCYNPCFNNKEECDRYNSQWENYCKSSKLSDKIFCFNHRLSSQESVAALMRVGNCGVFISRAEGFNLELLETMSCGTSVIATYNTGHTQICNENNSTLIKQSKYETAFDGIWFRETPIDFWNNEKVGMWASFDEEDKEKLIERFKWFYYLDDAYRFEECIETAKNFSWERCCLSIMKCVNGI